MVLQRGYSDSWFSVCKSAGVGEITPEQHFPVHGGRKTRSVVRDCEKELAAGRQPIVPMPAHTVYVPYPDRTSWSSLTCSGLSEIVEEKEAFNPRKHLTEISGNDRETGRLKRPIGAIRKASGGENTERQRQHYTVNPSRLVSSKVAKIEQEENIKQERRPDFLLPRKGSGSNGLTSQETQLNRVTAKRPAQKIRCKDMPDGLPLVKKQCSRKPVGVLEDDIPKVATDEGEFVRVRQTSATMTKSAALITDPSNVLKQACKFRDNLTQALAKKGMPSRLAVSGQKLPFVSKWVDYSRKHGVGYVLEDGGIGCIFNATTEQPVTCVIVRDGYKYLKEAKGNPRFVDKLPMDHYADCKGDGIKPINVTKERKRVTGVLWTKFGLYMCQQLGQGEVPPPEENGSQGKSFVKFHQRLGSTGVWGFGNGAFQVLFFSMWTIAFSNTNKKTYSLTFLITRNWSYQQMADIAALRAFLSKGRNNYCSAVSYRQNSSGNELKWRIRSGPSYLLIFRCAKLSRPTCSRANWSSSSASWIGGLQLVESDVSRQKLRNCSGKDRN